MMMMIGTNISTVLLLQHNSTPTSS